MREWWWLRSVGDFVFCAYLAHAERFGHRWHVSGFHDRGAAAGSRSAIIDRSESVHGGSLVEEGAVPKSGFRIPEWPQPWAGKLNDDIAVIGQGSAGTVYTGTLACDGSGVAVKEMQISAKRVDAEVATMKLFGSYPDFVAYFDHQQVQDEDGDAIHYIMMELLEAGDLYNVIFGLNRATLDQKYGLFYNMLEGVKKMHDKNIVHRDIKPGNIFVSGPCAGRAPCTAKVGDFGDACQVDGIQKFAPVPLCSGVRGTESYMSPEISIYEITDLKNDVWSLGMVLYELTFNVLPLPPEENFARRFWSLLRPVTWFNLKSDALFRSLPDNSLIKRLLRGMLEVNLKDRLSSSDALAMASPLAAHSAPRSVASLPECFYAGENRSAPVIEGSHEGRVEHFRLEDAPANVMIVVVSYLFNEKTVDPKTGIVIDPKRRLGPLRARGYFPESLKLGDRILEVNGAPYASVGRREQERLKEGAQGSSLSIKYESARPA